jgi:hypothetical protein
MTKITFITKLIVFICLFSINSIFSQTLKSITADLFGKPTQNQNGFIRCASSEYEEFLAENNTNRMTTAQFEAWIAPIIEQQKQDALAGLVPQTIFNIPVVIHVIHNGDPVNTASSHSGENISYAQAISQINVMNQDFRRLLGTPGNGSSGYNLGIDCEVNFCLAQQDPSGNATDGVHRVNLGQASWSTTAINSTVKPATQWDPTKYLNMWTVRFTDSSLLGYAQFPSGSGLGGLNASGGASNTDGVVANYNAFGTIAENDGTFELNTTYNLGRTMTHEVGHWIGLRHIWGDDTACTGNNATSGDYVADTPDSDGANYTCAAVTSCLFANDMIENYMDYTNDACMNTFTAGQKARMVAVMTNSVNRNTLSASNACLPGTIYGLDAKINSCSVITDGCDTAIYPTVMLENKGTSTLTSIQINYSIDNVNSQSYTWTGSLASNVVVEISLPSSSATSGGHTFYATVGNVNSVADQNSGNNGSSAAFSIAPNHNSTSVVFRLQNDIYGSETTWSLKNSAGTPIYSSVAYTNVGGTNPNAIPAVITQNWTLASNECYTFTINDSYGDGICCAYGNGYYDIKSTDGLTTLVSGSAFTTTESKNFGVNLLENANFEKGNHVIIYPNPTSGILNIGLQNEFDLPTSYTISNLLGQTMAQKMIVTSEDLSINTITLTKGVYLITIVKNNERKTIRFIKE